jgi:hypothetical protein
MENEENIRMSYLAGAIDGDGSLALGKAIRRNQVNHYPMIQLGNLKEELIDAFISEFKGQKNIRDGKLNRRKFYIWRVTNSPKCLPILEKLIPFLIGKKDRALHLKDYILENPSLSGGKKLEGDVIFRREKSFLKMKDLNFFNPLLLTQSKKSCEKDSDDPCFWSYVAGLFDTDGHFSISARQERYFRPHIHLHMMDLRCINYINENFIGGRLGLKKDKTSKYGFIYRWEISLHEKIRNFLNKIIPYLRQKKSQAIIMLKFLNEKKQYTNCKPCMPEEEINFRRQCKEEISKLNKCDLYKSSLMDLNTQTDSAEGNKAQAAKACSVNVASEKTTKVDAVL